MPGVAEHVCQVREESLGATSRRGRTQCPHAPAADAARSCRSGTGCGAETHRRRLSTSAVDADFEASTGVRRRLVAADHAQLRPVLFRLQARRLPLPRRVLEAGLEQRLLGTRCVGRRPSRSVARSRRPSRRGGLARRWPLEEPRSNHSRAYQGQRVRAVALHGKQQSASWPRRYRVQAKGQSAVQGAYRGQGAGAASRFVRVEEKPVCPPLRGG